MVRVVTDIVKVFDNDNNFVRDVSLNETGFFVENLRFMALIAKKDYTEFLKELCIYKKILEKIDNDNIIANVENFDNNQKKFEDLYISLSKKYPKKIDKASKSVEKYSFATTFKIDVFGSFLDHKHNSIEFYLDDTFIVRYPLIPEFSGKIFTRAMYGSRYERTETIVLNLYMAKIFLESLYDEYQDNKFLSMSDEIDDILYDYESEMHDMSLSIKSALTYQIKEQDSVCNNIDMFVEYTINKLINNKNIEALEQLHKIILFTNQNNPNFNFIFDELAIFNNTFFSKEEYDAFIKMKSKYNLEYIISSYITNFHSLSITEKYQSLFNSDPGSERTLN